MTAGLEEISTGEIVIGKRIVNDLQPRNRDISMVFQSYALYPHMTVFNNIAFGLRARKFNKDEIKKKVHDTARSLEIDTLLNRKPKELSGGQRQRVALARAIVRNPQVFLMDEPLSNLDAKMRVNTRAELKKLHKKLKTTVIYVTHDQVEAMTMGSRIAILRDGVLQQVDSPENVYHFPSNMFVAEFIGSPSMNFIEGELHEESGKLYFMHDPLKIALTSFGDNFSHPSTNKIVLGIRPEHISINSDVNNSNVARFPATIDVIEPLGGQAILFFLMNSTQIVAMADFRKSIKENEIVKITFDMEHAHFFDTESRRTLRK
jgi:multiple sugar transport system ATP-binding protein